MKTKELNYIKYSFLILKKNLNSNIFKILNENLLNQTKFLECFMELLLEYSNDLSILVKIKY